MNENRLAKISLQWCSIDRTKEPVATTVILMRDSLTRDLNPEYLRSQKLVTNVY